MKAKEAIYMFSSFVVLAMMSVALIVAAYWILAPYAVITVRPNITITHETIHPGGEQHILLSYCKWLPYMAIGTRQLVCSKRTYKLESFRSDFDTGCRTNTIDISIPCDIETPDSCFVVTKYHYDVNPLRSVTYGWQTGFFRVEK
jgi:hypothetical protein